MEDMIRKPEDITKRVEEFAEEWKLADDEDTRKNIDDRVFRYLKAEAPHKRNETNRYEFREHYDMRKKEE